MLTELEKVPQHGGRRRRWFRSAKQELIVWFSEDDAIWGFQLCYDLDKQEKALTWTQDRGFAHERVDDGEDVGLRHKRTPILVIDGAFDAQRVLRDFLGVAASLPESIVAFVRERLGQYGQYGEYVQHPGRGAQDA